MASQELWDAIDNFDYKEYLRRKGLSEDKIPETLDDSKKAALFKAANDDYFANLVEQYESDPFMKKADAEDKAREKLLEGRPWIRPLYGLWEEEKTAEELYSPDTVLAEVIRRNNITPSANGSINTQNFTPGLANKEINDVIEQYAEAITSRPGLKYDAPELDGVSKSKFIEEFKYRNGLSNFETVKSFIDLYQRQRIQRLREQQEADPDYNWQTAALKEGAIGGWEMLGNAMQYWGDVFMNWSDSISDSSQQLFGVRLNQRVDRTDPASSLVLRMRNKGIQWRDEAINDRAKHGYIPRYDGTLQDYWNEGGPWAKALWEQALTNWPSVAQNVLPFAVGAGLVPILGRAAAMRAGLGLAGLSAIGPGGALSTGDVLQDLNDLGIYNPEEVSAMLPYVVGAVALDFGSDVLGVLGVTGLGRSASSAVLNKVFAGRAEREAAKQALFRMAEAAGGVSADTVAGAAARVSLGMQARQVLANGAGFFGKATEKYLLPGMGAFMTELWTERAQEDLAMQLANYASSPAIQGKSAWESTKDLAKAWANKGFNPRNILPWGDETMFVQDANGAIYPQRLQRHRLLSAGLLGGLMGGGTHTIVTGIQDLAGFTPERTIRDMSEKLQILDKDGNPVLGQVEKRRRGMAERLFAVLQQRNQGVTEQSVVGIDIENNGGNVIASFNGHTGTGSNAAEAYMDLSQQANEGKQQINTKTIEEVPGVGWRAKLANGEEILVKGTNAENTLRDLVKNHNNDNHPLVISRGFTAERGLAGGHPWTITRADGFAVRAESLYDNYVFHDFAWNPANNIVMDSIVRRIPANEAEQRIALDFTQTGAINFKGQINAIRQAIANSNGRLELIKHPNAKRNALFTNTEMRVADTRFGIVYDITLNKKATNSNATVTVTGITFTGNRVQLDSNVATQTLRSAANRGALNTEIVLRAPTAGLNITPVQSPDQTSWRFDTEEVDRIAAMAGAQIRQQTPNRVDMSIPAIAEGVQIQVPFSIRVDENGVVFVEANGQSIQVDGINDRYLGANEAQRTAQNAQSILQVQALQGGEYEVVFRNQSTGEMRVRRTTNTGTTVEFTLDKMGQYVEDSLEVVAAPPASLNRLQQMIDDGINRQRARTSAQRQTQQGLGQLRDPDLRTYTDAELVNLGLDPATIRDELQQMFMNRLRPAAFRSNSFEEFENELLRLGFPKGRFIYRSYTDGTGLSLGKWMVRDRDDVQFGAYDDTSQGFRDFRSSLTEENIESLFDVPDIVPYLLEHLAENNPGHSTLTFTDDEYQKVISKYLDYYDRVFRQEAQVQGVPLSTERRQEIETRIQQQIDDLLRGQLRLVNVQEVLRLYGGLVVRGWAVEDPATNSFMDRNGNLVNERDNMDAFFDDLMSIPMNLVPANHNVVEIYRLNDTLYGYDELVEAGNDTDNINLITSTQNNRFEELVQEQIDGYIEKPSQRARRGDRRYIDRLNSYLREKLQQVNAITDLGDLVRFYVGLGLNMKQYATFRVEDNGVWMFLGKDGKRYTAATVKNNKSVAAITKWYEDETISPTKFAQSFKIGQIGYTLTQEDGTFVFDYKFAITNRDGNDLTQGQILSGQSQMMDKFKEFSVVSAAFDNFKTNDFINDELIREANSEGIVNAKDEGVIRTELIAELKTRLNNSNLLSDFQDVYGSQLQVRYGFRNLVPGNNYGKYFGTNGMKDMMGVDTFLTQEQAVAINDIWANNRANTEITVYYVFYNKEGTAIHAHSREEHLDALMIQLRSTQNLERIDLDVEVQTRVEESRRAAGLANARNQELRRQRQQAAGASLAQAQSTPAPSIPATTSSADQYLHSLLGDTGLANVTNLVYPFSNEYRQITQTMRDAYYATFVGSKVRDLNNSEHDLDAELMRLAGNLYKNAKKNGVVELYQTAIEFFNANQNARNSVLTEHAIEELRKTTQVTRRDVNFALGLRRENRPLTAEQQGWVDEVDRIINGLSQDEREAIYKRQGVQGYWDSEAGRVILVAESIPLNHAHRVFAHELRVHATAHMTDDLAQNWVNIADFLKSQMGQDTEVGRALDRIYRFRAIQFDETRWGFWEEMAAYFVEDYEGRIPFTANIKAHFRHWFRRSGIFKGNDDITAADIVVFAKAAGSYAINHHEQMKQATEGIPTQGEFFSRLGTAFSVPENVARTEFEAVQNHYGSAERNVLMGSTFDRDTGMYQESNLNDAHWTLVRTPFYKKWFGDWEMNPNTASKIVDTNGEPLVVVHNTQHDYSAYDAPFVGNNGFFGHNGQYVYGKVGENLYNRRFSDRPRKALFLNVRNPLPLHNYELMAPIMERLGYEESAKRLDLWALSDSVRSNLPLRNLLESIAGFSEDTDVDTSLADYLILNDNNITSSFPGATFDEAHRFIVGLYEAATTPANSILTNDPVVDSESIGVYAESIEDEATLAHLDAAAKVFDRRLEGFENQMLRLAYNPDGYFTSLDAHHGDLSIVTQEPITDILSAINQRALILGEEDMLDFKSAVVAAYDEILALENVSTLQGNEAFMNLFNLALHKMRLDEVSFRLGDGLTFRTEAAYPVPTTQSLLKEHNRRLAENMKSLMIREGFDGIAGTDDILLVHPDQAKDAHGFLNPFPSVNSRRTQGVTSTRMEETVMGLLDDAITKDARTLNVEPVRLRSEYRSIYRANFVDQPWMQSNLDEYSWIMARTPSFKQHYGEWQHDPTPEMNLDYRGEPVRESEGFIAPDRIVPIQDLEQVKANNTAFYFVFPYTNTGNKTTVNPAYFSSISSEALERMRGDRKTVNLDALKAQDKELEQLTLDKAAAESALIVAQNERQMVEDLLTKTNEEIAQLEQTQAKKKLNKKQREKYDTLIREREVKMRDFDLLMRDEIAVARQVQDAENRISQLLNDPNYIDNIKKVNEQQIQDINDRKAAFIRDRANERVTLILRMGDINITLRDNPGLEQDAVNTLVNQRSAIFTQVNDVRDQAIQEIARMDDEVTRIITNDPMTQRQRDLELAQAARQSLEQRIDVLGERIQEMTDEANLRVKGMGEKGLKQIQALQAQLVGLQTQLTEAQAREQSFEGEFTKLDQILAQKLDTLNQLAQMDGEIAAEQMEQAGKDAATILLVTGFERDRSGKWWYRGSNSKGKFRNPIEILYNTIEEIYGLAGKNVPKIYRDAYDNFVSAQEEIKKILEESLTIGKPASTTKIKMYDAHVKPARKIYGFFFGDQTGTFTLKPTPYDNFLNKITDTAVQDEIRKRKNALHDAFVHKKGYRLEDVYEDDNLYKAYPFLRDMKVFFKYEKGAGGSFTAGTQYSSAYINVNPLMIVGTFHEILLHEIQHAIQWYEGVLYTHGTTKYYHRMKELQAHMIGFIDTLPQDVVQTITTPDFITNFYSDWTNGEGTLTSIDDTWVTTGGTLVPYVTTSSPMLTSNSGLTQYFSNIGIRGAELLDRMTESSTRMNNFIIAQRMEREGKDARTIKFATGWEHKEDGWRYEIDDTKNKLKSIELSMDKDYVLSDLIDAPEIFAAYPEIKDYSLYVTDAGTGVASFSPSGKTFDIPEDVGEYLLGSLHHEIQHAIQDIEGFSPGTSLQDMFFNIKSPYRNIALEEFENFKKRLNETMTREEYLKNAGWNEDDLGTEEFEKSYNDYVNTVSNFRMSDAEIIDTVARDIYRRAGGEVEANNIETRLRMSSEQRRRSLLSDTESVLESDQIHPGYFSTIPNGLQKQANVQYPDFTETQVSSYFSLSKRTREEAIAQMRKPREGRPDLTEEEMNIILDELDKYDDRKKQLLTLKWILNGSIAMPIRGQQYEDEYKVDEAIKLASRNKVDPFKYESPVAILNEYIEFHPDSSPINPETFPEIVRDSRIDHGDGIVSYEIADTREGQETARKIINSHLGKGWSNWCLTRANTQGELQQPDSWEMWKHYNGLPKRMAFKNGKLISFMATSAGYDIRSAFDLMLDTIKDEPEFMSNYTHVTDIRNMIEITDARRGIKRLTANRFDVWMFRNALMSKNDKIVKALRYFPEERVNELRNLQSLEDWSRYVQANFEELKRETIDADDNIRSQWLQFKRYYEELIEDPKSFRIEKSEDETTAFIVTGDGKRVNIPYDPDYQVDFTADFIYDAEKDDYFAKPQEQWWDTKDISHPDLDWARGTMEGYTPRYSAINPNQVLGYFSRIDTDLFTPLSSQMNASDLVNEDDTVSASDLGFFSKITNRELINRLDAEPKAYDGKLYRMVVKMETPTETVYYPVMATRIGGTPRNPVFSEPIPYKEWEQADERPELIFTNKDGKFKYPLLKDDGNRVDADYAPYTHSSTFPLNDQFTTAYKRPNLVILRVEVPQSEIDNPYRATFEWEGEEHEAPNATGMIKWNKGTVTKALGREREVVLSRYSKAVQELTDAEVADIIVPELKEKGVGVPINVVTPGLLQELVRRGVEILDPVGFKLKYEEQRAEHERLARIAESIRNEGIDSRYFSRAIPAEPGTVEYTTTYFSRTGSPLGNVTNYNTDIYDRTPIPGAPGAYKLRNGQIFINPDEVADEHVARNILYALIRENKQVMENKNIAAIIDTIKGWENSADTRERNFWATIANNIHLAGLSGDKPIIAYAAREFLNQHIDARNPQGTNTIEGVFAALLNEIPEIIGQVANTSTSNVNAMPSDIITVTNALGEVQNDTIEVAVPGLQITERDLEITQRRIMAPQFMEGVMEDIKRLIDTYEDADFQFIKGQGWLRYGDMMWNIGSNLLGMRNIVDQIMHGTIDYGNYDMTDTTDEEANTPRSAFRDFVQRLPKDSPLRNQATQADVEEFLRVFPAYIRDRIKVAYSREPEWEELFGEEKNGIYKPYLADREIIFIKAYGRTLADVVGTISYLVSRFGWTMWNNSDFAPLMDELYTVLKHNIKEELPSFFEKLQGNPPTPSEKAALVSAFISHMGGTVYELEYFAKKSSFVPSADEQKVIDIGKRFREKIKDLELTISKTFAKDFAENEEITKEYVEKLLRLTMAPLSGQGLFFAYDVDHDNLRQYDGSIPSSMQKWENLSHVTVFGNDYGPLYQAIPSSEDALTNMYMANRFRNASPYWRNVYKWWWRNRHPPMKRPGDTILGLENTVMLGRAFKAVTQEFGLALKNIYKNVTALKDELMRKGIDTDEFTEAKGYEQELRDRGITDEKLLEKAKITDTFLRYGRQRVLENVIEIRALVRYTSQRLEYWMRQENALSRDIQKMHAEMERFANRFVSDWDHRKYQAYTEDGQNDLHEMRTIVNAARVTSERWYSDIVEQNKNDLSNLEKKKQTGQIDEKTYAKERKKLRHAIKIHERLDALFHWATQDEMSQLPAQGSPGYDQRLSNVLGASRQAMINKIDEIMREVETYKERGVIGKMDLIPGARKRTLNENDPHDLLEIIFLDPVKDPALQLIFNLDQQGKITDKLIFNLRFGENLLAGGIATIKGSTETTPIRVDNLSWLENGTFLRYVQVDPFFMDEISNEVKLQDYIRQNIFGEVITTVKQNLTILNWRMAISNYIGNISNLILTGEIFRIQNLRKGMRLAKDKWWNLFLIDYNKSVEKIPEKVFAKSINEASAEYNELIKMYQHEMDKLNIWGSGISSAEITMYGQGGWEKHVDLIAAALQTASEMANTDTFDEVTRRKWQRAAHSFMRGAREFYGFGDEWVKPLTYLNNRAVALAKYRALHNWSRYEGFENTQEAKQINEQIMDAATREAALLTFKETTTWELSPDIVRQLARTRVRVLTPDFLLHAFQMVRIYATNFYRTKEVAEEMARLRAKGKENLNPYEEAYLSLLRNEFWRRTAGQGIYTWMAAELATYGGSSLAWIFSSFAAFLTGGGGDDDEKRKKRKEERENSPFGTTFDEHTGMSMLLTGISQVGNLYMPLMWVPGKVGHEFYAYNGQRAHAALTITPVTPPTTDPTWLERFNIILKQIVNYDSDPLSLQIANIVRQKNSFGQKITGKEQLFEMLGLLTPQVIQQGINIGRGTNELMTGTEELPWRERKKHRELAMFDVAGFKVQRVSVDDNIENLGRMIDNLASTGRNPYRREFFKKLENNLDMDESAIKSAVDDILTVNERDMGRVRWILESFRKMGVEKKRLESHLAAARNTGSTILGKQYVGQLLAGRNVLNSLLLTSLNEKISSAEKLREGTDFPPNERRKIIDNYRRAMRMIQGADL